MDSFQEVIVSNWESIEHARIDLPLFSETSSKAVHRYQPMVAVDYSTAQLCLRLSTDLKDSIALTRTRQRTATVYLAMDCPHDFSPLFYWIVQWTVCSLAFGRRIHGRRYPRRTKSSSTRLISLWMFTGVRSSSCLDVLVLLKWRFLSMLGTVQSLCARRRSCCSRHWERPQESVEASELVRSYTSWNEQWVEYGRANWSWIIDLAL